ncbi:MAG: DUF4416 family protein [Nitrospirota bacterium]
MSPGRNRFRHGTLHPPEPALLFIGTLYSRPEIFDRAATILRSRFGGTLFTSSPAPWDYSPYYRNELGHPIFRQFIFFRETIDPGTLADIKLDTIHIEEEFSTAGQRSINLDPGYLCLSKVVLASTKNYSHRIYLGKGIYAEVTLFYRRNTYHPHLFTYRDYQDNASLELFLRMRKHLEKK